MIMARILSFFLPTHAIGQGWKASCDLLTVVCLFSRLWVGEAEERLRLASRQTVRLIAVVILKKNESLTGSRPRSPDSTCWLVEGRGGTELSPAGASGRARI